jgi:hypothetical protein
MRATSLVTTARLFRQVGQCTISTFTLFSHQLTSRPIADPTSAPTQIQAAALLAFIPGSVRCNHWPVLDKWFHGSG